MKIFGASNDLGSLWQAFVASSQRAKAKRDHGVIDLVEGRDYVMRQDPVSSVWTEQRISNPPVGGSSPSPGAKVGT